MNIEQKQQGFIRTIVLIVIVLFILSYFGIFKIEEHLSWSDIKDTFNAFVAWLKGLFS